MTRHRWTFRRSPELEAAIADLEPVLKHKVNKDIEKVETRGDRPGRRAIGSSPGG